MIDYDRSMSNIRIRGFSESVRASKSKISLSER
jgi:hypothetical protein